jgi:putative membrane protein
MMGGYGAGWGMGWFGMIAMLVFWVLVIVAIVYLIRWLAVSSRAGGREGRPEYSALEILKKRYARGEIDKEEFEEKRKVLES